MTTKVATIGQLLAAVRDGNFADRLSVDMRELLMELQDAKIAGDAPKGKITVTFEFSLTKDHMMVAATAKVEGPKEAKSPSAFWLLDEGILSASNPRQHELPLRTVGAGDQPVRTVVGGGDAPPTSS